MRGDQGQGVGAACSEPWKDALDGLRFDTWGSVVGVRRGELGGIRRPLPTHRCHPINSVGVIIRWKTTYREVIFKAMSGVNSSESTRSNHGATVVRLHEDGVIFH